MRRKSERVKDKDKPVEKSPKKTRTRSSRRRKKSSSTSPESSEAEEYETSFRSSHDETEEEYPNSRSKRDRSKHADVVAQPDLAVEEKEVKVTTGRTRKSSKKQTAEEAEDQIKAELIVQKSDEKAVDAETSEQKHKEKEGKSSVWQVKSADCSSGEIKKLKLCIVRPPEPPQVIAEQSPRKRKKLSRLSLEIDDNVSARDNSGERRKSRRSQRNASDDSLSPDKMSSSSKGRHKWSGESSEEGQQTQDSEEIMPQIAEVSVDKPPAVEESDEVIAIEVEEGVEDNDPLETVRVAASPPVEGNLADSSNSPPVSRAATPQDPFDALTATKVVEVEPETKHDPVEATVKIPEEKHVADEEDVKDMPKRQESVEGSLETKTLLEEPKDRDPPMERSKARNASEDRPKTRGASEERPETRESSEERSKVPELLEERPVAKAIREKTLDSPDEQAKDSASATCEEKSKARQSSEERSIEKVASEERLQDRDSSEERPKENVALEKRSKTHDPSEERSKSRDSSEERPIERVASEEKLKDRDSSEERSKTRDSSEERSKTRDSSEERSKTRESSEERSNDKAAAKDRGSPEERVDDKKSNERTKVEDILEERLKKRKEGMTEIDQVSTKAKEKPRESSEERSRDSSEERLRKRKEGMTEIDQVSTKAKEKPRDSSEERSRDSSEERPKVRNKPERLRINRDSSDKRLSTRGHSEDKSKSWSSSRKRDHQEPLEEGPTKSVNLSEKSPKVCDSLQVKSEEDSKVVRGRESRRLIRYSTEQAVETKAISRKEEQEASLEDESLASSYVQVTPIKPREKITLKRSSSKVNENNQDGDSNTVPRKRKWGASKSKPVLSISSDSLKSLVPEAKLLDVSEVQLTPEDDVEDEPEDGEVEVDRDSVEVKQELTPLEILPSPDFSKVAPFPSDDSKGRGTVPRKIKLMPDSLQRSPSPPRNRPSNILFITNLVRPFTLNQLKELLARTGTILEDGFWIDKIKSKCYVQYETEVEAKETRHALHGVRWPVSNPKQLAVDYGKKEDMDLARDLSDASQIPRKTEPLQLAGWKDELSREKEKEMLRRENEKIAREKAEHSRGRADAERAKIGASVREWDLGKIDLGDEGQMSREERRDKERRQRKERNYRSPSPRDLPAHKIKKKEEDAPAKLLDDLFRKTKLTPCIYWLPLTVEQIVVKEEMRRKHMAEHERRMTEMRKAEKERQRLRVQGRPPPRRFADRDKRSPKK